MTTTHTHKTQTIKRISAGGMTITITKAPKRKKATKGRKRSSASKRKKATKGKARRSSRTGRFTRR